MVVSHLQRFSPAMESPLDVLSRAASIVQNSNDRVVREMSVEKEGQSDSGYEDGPVTPRSLGSPVRYPSPMQCQPDHPPAPHLYALSYDSSESSLKLDKNCQMDLQKYHCGVAMLPGHMELAKFDSNRAESVKPERQGFLISDLKISDDGRSKSPPPLISLRDRNGSTLTSHSLPTYDSLFPRPSVISSFSATSCSTRQGFARSSSKPCCCCEPPLRGPTSPAFHPARYSPYYHELDMKRRSLIGSGVGVPFGLESPNVDEHFRKSLGDRYEQAIPKFDERPNSVDEHFAKALGKSTWYSIERHRSTESSPRASPQGYNKRHSDPVILQRYRYHHDSLEMKCS